MATVATALKMFDSFSRPLQQVTQALNITINAMEQMANAANMDTKFASQMKIARGKIQQAEAAFKQVVDQQDRVVSKQKEINNTIKVGTHEANGMFNTIKGFATTYLSFQVAKKGIDMILGGSTRLEQQLITMSGMLGNKDIGKAFFGSLNKYANDSVYGIKEFNAITRQFIQFTKSTDKLMKLNKTAERLAFLDPTQGLEGAGFALKEALGGDFMSLKGRFGFGSQDREMLQSAKDMDDFINKFNILLDKKGATQQALEEFNSSALAQFNNLGSNIEASFAQSGESTLEALKPTLQALNQGFKDGQFQSFFNSISIGFFIIASSVLGLTNALVFMGHIFSVVLKPIAPIILGVAAAYGLYWLVANASTIATIAHSGAIKAWTLITHGATKAQSMFNAALAFNPIAMIIGLVVGLIVALAALIATCEPVRKAFSSAFGYIVDAAEWAVNSIMGLINGAIKGINKVSQFFANLLGVKAKQIQEIEYKANFSGFKESGMKAIEDFSLDNLKAKFGLDKFTMPKDPAVGMSDSPLLKDWNEQQNDNFGLANDNLKKVNDKLDISNEKLELMRDIAEQQVVNRFTTATLAPQISLQFGDVRETADLDGIIPHVEKILTEQLMIAAEGVHV
ncbi:hypothetical protein HNQ80_004829 [Anaerosolibacter carboniphilus]|uniref:Phage tail tape measure protein n=1 Tax=Anaerosolibacter carboniphilus TaxID=1417629 RepID=A0A841L8R8_9FIRM|nr:hypothetical protein [Anaerosolibacter carboniphilus]MBB6218655.1 hypothetical protein [Anaerosolibacter carboniphilus]